MLKNAHGNTRKLGSQNIQYDNAYTFFLTYEKGYWVKAIDNVKLKENI